MKSDGSFEEEVVEAVVKVEEETERRGWQRPDRKGRQMLSEDRSMTKKQCRGWWIA
jgi:hypothetical protein